MERKLQEELELLKQDLLAMGARVEKNIGDAIQSLMQRDARLAREVGARDPLVDLAEIQIDERCVNLLALQQPVARDLRFVATALKIVKDLERIGDMAKDISERALAIMQEIPLKSFLELPAMAGKAQYMLKEALDAFVNQDVEMARRVINDDDEVDNFHDQIVAEIIELIQESPNLVEPCVHLIYVTKYLERIGDHSSNVAEMVVFLVLGKDIRHLQKIRPLMEGRPGG